ncbi:MAG TPA: hypothetical protein VFD65_00325 [Chitinophagales bacterium]|nr:hypothetical protein [Chitinophagales bacterium]
MIKNSYILLTAISLTLISCNQENNLKLQEATTVREDITTTDLYTNTNQDNIGSLATFTANNNQPGINPEHGQPGHRCDIPVGAPLNSTPQSNTPTSTTPTIQQIEAPPTNTNNTTKAGLNPEHGQPGHRCDIPVGAPLNSTSQSNTPTSTTPTIQQIETPPTNTNDTKAGLNPEHGQPGHRCDIPVGAPLNSTPANTESNPTQLDLQPSNTDSEE